MVLLHSEENDLNQNHSYRNSAWECDPGVTWISHKDAEPYGLFQRQQVLGCSHYSMVFKSLALILRETWV